MQNQKEKLKVVVILGPTSSGKTNLSIKLAQKFNGIIISADSRQIYRDLDIATAKTTRDEQGNVPHYMINIVNPDEDFNIQFYQDAVYDLLHSIVKLKTKHTKKVVPFIVGGTGLYIKAIVDGYKIPQVKPNKKLRARLEKLSIEKLTKMLKKIDFNTKIDLKNKRRVIRAIEIYKSHNNPVITKQQSEFEFIQLGVLLPKEQLFRRIENKVDQMHKDGLVKETIKLIKKGYDFNSPALSSLGYKHIKDYLEHKITLEKALELMKTDTKKYAKRQLTWFKKDKRIHWIRNKNQAQKLISNFLKT